MPEIKQQSLQINYLKEEDILHLLISEEPESASIEIYPNVMAELNACGKLIGVEILNALVHTSTILFWNLFKLNC